METSTGTEATGSSRLADEVRRDLSRTPRRLQPRHLYDALGSRLFEAICELPQYPITRAERRLLEAHAAEIGDGMARPVTLVELGGGSGEKLALVARPIAGRGPLRVELVDVSATALTIATRTLSRIPGLTVTGHEATYEQGLRRIAAARSGPGDLLAAFLGSNIGNLDPPAAVRFLAEVRASLRAGDRLLLGADLVKAAARLVQAYDDPLGVTAAFNKNVLARLNRELGADFDLEQFAHRAIWNAGASRVEMHLESLCPQTVSIPGADLQVRLAEGESIWTESSYKYTTDGIVQLGESSGFIVRDQWVEPDARFALTVFVAE